MNKKTYIAPISSEFEYHLEGIVCDSAPIAVLVNTLNPTTTETWETVNLY